MSCRINPCTPLQGGQIRLINDGYQADRPFLITVDIDDAPEYSAISYCWGTENCLHAVAESEDGSEKWVATSALYEALSSLKRRGRRGFLWADMLCIDQSSDEEKTQQIPRMAEIFSKAASVYAYLGPSPKGNDLTMLGLNNVHRAWRQLNTEHVRQLGHGMRYTSPLPVEVYARLDHIFEVNDVMPFASPFWREVLEILRASWWRRMWTFQEAVVARKLEFLFGDVLLEDEDLIWDIIQCFMNLSYEKDVGKLGRPRIELHTSTIELMDLASLRLSHADRWRRDDSRSAGGSLHLPDGEEQGDLADPLEAEMDEDGVEGENRPWDTAAYESIMVLWRVGGRRCTYKQDAIYSVLGLLDPEVRQDISVDLTDSPQVVFIRAASALVKRDLRTLVSDPTVNRMEGLPSWVRDWSEKRGVAAISHSIQGGSAGSLRAQTSARMLDDDITRIRLQGFVLAAVKKCVPFDKGEVNMSMPKVLPADSRLLDRYGEWTDECLRAMRSEVPRSSVRIIPRGFFETVALGIQNFRYLDGSTKTWRTKAAVSYVRHALRSSLRRLIEGNFLPNPAPLHELASLLGYVRLGHSFIITTDGRMGIASVDVRPGDLVCIINEADFPLVLRPRKENGVYQYLREAYIHGVMDGEALESHPVEEDIDFILD